ncbi:hypothetical protein MKX01_021816 [Papaver californicum]|nr:hypothetical protein MKX01_021816 [Papaver californicum]
MVVASGLGLQNANPIFQMRKPQSDFSLITRKETNLRFFCSIPQKTPSFRKSRNLSNKNFSCRCSNSSSSSSSSTEWDWSRWNQRFSEIEETESISSVLKYQLRDAVEKEDFEEAVKLKRAIAEATSKDSVAEIMSQLKNAIDEERYHDASKLCRISGSNLVGWWVGCSKDFDDPFGRVVRITPGVGRFVAKSYTPRQLVTKSSGTPLFEIYVVKDANDRYMQQVVFLRRNKGSSTVSSSSSSSTSPSKVSEDPPNVNSENSADKLVDNEEDEPHKSQDTKSVNIRDTSEEGIKGVINFLKDKIPGLKLKVMNVNVSEEIIEDGESLEQLVQENENEKTDASETSEDETESLDEVLPEGFQLREAPSTRDESKSLAMKLFIGGVLHNKDDIPLKDDFVRSPAEIRDMEKDSFVLHIPEKIVDADIGELEVSEVKLATVAAEGVSELMPRDVAKAFWSVDKVPSKISKDVREIVKLAVSQAQKHNRLSTNTNFSQIISNDDSDPFTGLYIGAFGPYGPEVVQLTRKFGYWNSTDDVENVEFFEYVEAVKLTGDLNVPAGEVTFCAKIGKANRNANRGAFPDELGVVASYKGQGRIAEFGFRNPQWVDGELLQLRGKGMGPYIKGADLGFLYVVPEQSFLVLFSRLKLPE